MRPRKWQEVAFTYDPEFLNLELTGSYVVLEVDGATIPAVDTHEKGWVCLEPEYVSDVRDFLTGEKLDWLQDFDQAREEEEK